MAKTATPQARLADAAFRLLGRQQWPDLTLAGVARAAKVPIADMQALAPSRPALLGVMFACVGEDTARRYKSAGADPLRDRVFDVALTWFEVLAAKKQAMRTLHEGLARDPLALIAARGALLKSAEWLLVLAEADAGRALPLRAAALAALLVRTVPVWLGDDKELSKTMARLDGGLKRMEWLL